MLVRLDGAGFSHDLLEHIAAGGGTKGRGWEFSVGWSCTDTEMDAIERLPQGAWTAGIDQNGDLVHDTIVAGLTDLTDLTGLTGLSSWHEKIPGLRIMVRDEPLHPRYRTRATEPDKQLERRYQLIATNTRVGQIAWLDARHRSHVHVENDVKQATDLGLNRWPSRYWAINVAWTQIVALAATPLTCFHHLTLPEGELRDTAPKLLRYQLLHLPTRLTPDQRTRWLHLRADRPWTDDVINTWRAVTALAAPT
ncbi:MAG: transposase [Pseudonocardia sp.]